MCSSNFETLLEGIKDKIAHGDQNAFRQLFNYYSKKLMPFARSIVKSNDAAREVVDEVFIKMWRNKEGVTSIQNLKVYLYTATKNNALNYLSLKANQAISEPFDFFEVELSDGSPSPERRMIGRELLRKINEAIESLPPRCKMIFKLIREDGMTYKEVGEVLNISPKTVDAQMVIAVRQISEKVKLDFDYFPNRNSRKK
jgi:RNA polymerase sigma-70 factor (family 1)